MTHDEYAEKIEYLYHNYRGHYNNKDYRAMREIIIHNLEDFNNGLIENKLLKATCDIWQRIQPRTCSKGLHSKYIVVLAEIKPFINRKEQ